MLGTFCHHDALVFRVQIARQTGEFPAQLAG
jgi:hypothetical protein